MKRSELEELKARLAHLQSVEEKWNDIDAVRARVDELGKLQQTEGGNGSMLDPYKVWNPGVAVKAGDWWQTHDGYLWEAVKDGIPKSSTDREYWEIVGL